ncbi:tRNA uridine-5-carboxymethylaminomethyl(34) synthesis GTPase MnmE [Silvibacterium dinghuense]|uniref:tRNA uridine-5-carboxymethylaminomethyl(34) synthesis GTPase MnmE n=1 Tax=Silvibacterium dinghuense TaxID=1560006 RepID=UPI00198A0705|nr:tRNA uridine-5-carboxymethylaminomethyl(34) synthesis GTPase MnmE [Silvibacterium dinghuense]GGH01825.1 tRNA modification GTPase MnmE [Silvibacterium dinghuense]
MQPHPQIAEQEDIAGETIAAVSTPPGRGGIGIVRLSGPHALAISNALLALRNPLEHAMARFAEIRDPETGGKLDEAIATYFAKPRSYTGEDLVEIAAHGSPVVLDLLLRWALQQGARLARPGEFTERAFLSGRLDLTQAEAVRDLIDAQTLYQARTAAEQMGGAISRRIQPAKEKLVELISLLEAGIDFAEDDVDLTPDEEIGTRIDAVGAELAGLARSFERGRIVHSGLTLAIVGRPNVGKSSLFNRLVERERAIVTAIPGTTRDLVTERVSLGGIPLELVDTAGLRTTADEAEAMGIAKSREALADADIVLVVLEAGIPPSEEEAELLASLHGRRFLAVYNKIDLEDSSSGQGHAEEQSIRTSAATGAGIEALREALLNMVRTPGGESESGMLTNLRQHEAVKSALDALGDARAATANGTPHEMILLDLYSALRQLDSLTGETTADDILNRIFSTFCIGK